jgi:hypothetical protein
MRTAAAAAALLLLSPLLVACRTQCMADADESPEQMAKERRAAGRAQSICKELQRPQVTLTGDRLMLAASREVEVARRADVPDSGARFAPLFVRLDRYRRHFKAVWPADRFEPFATIEVDPALESMRVLSLATTAADAGFTSFRVKAGDASADVVWDRCGDRLRALPPGRADAFVRAARAACGER